MFGNKKEKEPTRLVWEEISGKNTKLFSSGMQRTKVPGGWLVSLSTDGTGLTFYPDPNHEWNGCSLP